MEYEMPTDIRKSPFIKNKKTSLEELFNYIIMYYAMSFSLGKRSCEKLFKGDREVIDSNYNLKVKVLEEYFLKILSDFNNELSGLDFTVEVTKRMIAKDNDDLSDYYKLALILKDIILTFKGLEYVSQINEEDYDKDDLIDWSVIYENNYWEYKTFCEDEEKTITQASRQSKTVNQPQVTIKDKLVKYCLKDNFNLLWSITILYLAGIVFMSIIQNLDIVEENMEYAIFVILKWLIMVTSGWSAYRIYLNDKTSKWLLVFGSIAVLFNPVFKIPFEQDSWYIINFIVLILYFIYFGKLYKTSE